MKEFLKKKKQKTDKLLFLYLELCEQSQLLSTPLEEWNHYEIAPTTSN